MTDRGGELLRSGRPWLVPAIGCVVLLIASFILAVLLGGSELTPRQALEALFGGRGDGTIPHDRIEARRVAIVSVRVPRVVLAALLGASLAPAGAAYQGLFRNPLADPYIVGVASGAGLGATIVIAVAGSFAAATIYAVPLGGFVGGAAAVGCVILIARARGTTSTATLLLAGVAVGALASALTTFIMMSSPDGVRRVFQWLHGGYTAGGWQPILIVVPYALLGLVGLLACAHPLNVLQLDEEEARQLGIAVERVKLVTLGSATLMTAAAVAFGGLLGFVGLVVPHVLRLLGVRDHRALIPLSAIGGAAFLVLADLVARVAIAPRELPTGVITALVGGPFFLALLARGSRVEGRS